jgi:outer membrane immunogenic protein
MKTARKKYLAGTVAALVFAIPTVGVAGGKMGDVAEPVIITPAPTPAPVAEWTGFYGGLGVAYGRGASSTGISTPLFEDVVQVGTLAFNPSVTGFLGTARLGYDIQRDNFVFGALIEGSLGKISGSDTGSVSFFENLNEMNGQDNNDIIPQDTSLASSRGRSCTQGNASFCVTPDPGNGGDNGNGNGETGADTLTAKASYSNLMSLALRAGTLVNDNNTLVYGRLGVSRAKLTATLPGNLGSISSTGTGINAGLGVEHRLTRNMSIFAEYNYHDVGKTFTANVDGADWTVNGKGLHTIGAGVNFRF